MGARQILQEWFFRTTQRAHIWVGTCIMMPPQYFKIAVPSPTFLISSYSVHAITNPSISLLCTPCRSDDSDSGHCSLAYMRCLHVTSVQGLLV